MNLVESIRNDLLKFEGFKQVVEGEEDVICTMEHNGNELKIHVHDGEYILKVNEDTLNEREMTDAEKKKREDIVMGMKKNKKDLQARYGDRWEEVMYATATKKAMESINEIAKRAIKNRS